LVKVLLVLKGLLFRRKVVCQNCLVGLVVTAIGFFVWSVRGCSGDAGADGFNIDKVVNVIERVINEVKE
jgi:hypothetical protein